MSELVPRNCHGNCLVVNALVQHHANLRKVCHQHGRVSGSSSPVWPTAKSGAVWQHTCKRACTTSSQLEESLPSEQGQSAEALASCRYQCRSHPTFQTDRPTHGIPCPFMRSRRCRALYHSQETAQAYSPLRPFSRWATPPHGRDARFAAALHVCTLRQRNNHEA